MSVSCERLFYTLLPFGYIGLHLRSLSQAPAMDDRLKAFDELFVKNNGDNLK